MAKAAWCTVTPTTGSGNKSISISSGAHTGRSARNTTVTVQNKNGTKPSKAITVSQASKAEFLTFETTKPAIPASGGTVIINGRSNTDVISLTEYKNGLSVTSTMKVGATVIPTNTGEVPGDPGAAAEYDFTVTIVIGANPSAKTSYIEIEVETGGGIGTTMCSIPILGNTSALTTDKTSISLVNAGTAQPVAVTSNDEWTIS